MEELLTTLKKSKAEMRDIVADGASVKGRCPKGKLILGSDGLIWGCHCTSK